MFNPLVSIIIPVYNGQNYLKEAINSAINQTYKNIEIIVINDGSKDNGATEEIAKSFGDKIKYYYKENGGVSSALNFGILKMSGEYFSWLSHDDLYLENKIEAQINALKKHEDKHKIVITDFYKLYENSKSLERVTINDYLDDSVIEDSYIPVLEAKIHGCSLLIHKSLFEIHGGFREDLRAVQDYELWFRMFNKRKHIYINEPLVIGRYHDLQVSKNAELVKKEATQFYKSIFNKIDKSEIEKAYGSLLNFELRMIRKRPNLDLTDAFDDVSVGLALNKADNFISDKDKLRELKSSLEIDKNDIYLFGAGQYGRIIQLMLKDRNIRILNFIDNDSSKRGKIVNDVEIITIDEVTTPKEDALIIVTALHDEKIINQLKTLGYKNIVDFKKINRTLFKIQP